MLNKIKPPLVLMLICIIVSGALVITKNLTTPAPEEIPEQLLPTELQEPVEKVLGEGNYELRDDITAEGIKDIVINRDNNMSAFRVIRDGYAKDGIDVLVAFDSEGKISGFSFVNLGETPGLGTKIEDESFLNQFIGTNDPELKVDYISGATYSSKGMKKAVATAVEAYNSVKDNLFSEKETASALDKDLEAGSKAVLGEGTYKLRSDITVEGIENIVVNTTNNSVGFQIIGDGYAKKSLNLFVGIDKDGKVTGIHFISNDETPGLGTKVEDDSFINQFIGADNADVSVDYVSGATYSSKGVKKAVVKVIEAYQTVKGDLINE